MKSTTTAQKVIASIQAHIAHSGDMTSGHLERALINLESIVESKLSIKSATSGNLLPAEISTTSNLRKFFGLPHIKLIVVGTNLKGLEVRSGWYKDADLIQLS